MDQEKGKGREGQMGREGRERGDGWDGKFRGQGERKGKG